MKLEHEGITKSTREIITCLHHNFLRRKNVTFAGKIPQLAGRTEERKRSWGNDKKMLEMEEQLKETKKNQTFPLTRRSSRRNAKAAARNRRRPPSVLNFNGPKEERRKTNEKEEALWIKKPNGCLWVWRKISKMVRGGDGSNAQREWGRRRRSDGFKSKRGAGACLAPALLVRNGLFCTGSYHNVLF